jgi:hypothetical protein
MSSSTDDGSDSETGLTTDSSDTSTSIRAPIRKRPELKNMKSMHI